MNTPLDPGRHLRRPALCHAEPAQRRGREGAELELAQLTQRYVSWFRGTVNGGMQMAEWIGDSGENVIEGPAATPTKMASRK